jgi:copper transporter 1
MIAVMTMNVGYFLSVLAGVFVGSVVFGRFIAYSSAH